MLDLQNDQVCQRGALANFAGDIPGFDRQSAIHTRIGAHLLKTGLDSQSMWALYFSLCIHNMQAVQRGILSLSNEDRLFHRCPACLLTAERDKNIVEKTIGVARGSPRLAPAARFGLGALLQNQARGGDIRLDLPAKLLLQRGAV